MAFGVPDHVGYAALALFVGIESVGVPVPGETALIAAGFLAQRGELDIGLVIAVASVSAIVGDNVGYLIGRKGGRALLLKPGPLHRHRLKVLEHGEPFFLKHGAPESRVLECSPASSGDQGTVFEPRGPRAHPGAPSPAACKRLILWSRAIDIYGAADVD